VVVETRRQVTVSVAEIRGRGRGAVASISHPVTLIALRCEKRVVFTACNGLVRFGNHMGVDHGTEHTTGNAIEEAESWKRATQAGPESARQNPK
jgi:hypothetical protein